MKANLVLGIIVSILLTVMFSLTSEVAMGLELKSSAFKNSEYIPKKYTGEGPDISPELSWSNAPAKTEQFALICDDPDAPGGDWVHWVIYDIPPEVFSLDEGIPGNAVLANGIKQGRNDFGSTGYGGPMPPHGKPHRYLFTLYALDSQLTRSPQMTKAELLRTIQGHILEKAELLGLYKR